MKNYRETVREYMREHAEGLGDKVETISLILEQTPLDSRNDVNQCLSGIRMYIEAEKRRRENVKTI